MTRLLIRADATTRMGTGHVMRGLSLAQAWQDAGGSVTFAVAELPTTLRERLLNEGCAVEITGMDTASTVAVVEKVQPEWVVLDGYQFGSDFQRAIKDTGRSLLVLDDYGHTKRYVADLVLNQNLGADARLYDDRENYTKLLLGPKFTLLRREFAKATAWQRKTPKVARKVMVTLGGTDPDNMNLVVIEALGRVSIEGMESIVVVGSSNPHLSSLETAVKRSTARIDLQVHVNDMPALMRWADVAVGAGGTTCWERAACRLPGLVVVLAENQAGVAAACDAAGLGWHTNITSKAIAERLENLMNDQETRSAMANRAAALMDSCGARRAVRVMIGSPTVSLRTATSEDARLVWEWANDPVTRAASFTTENIAWEAHSRWFAGKLEDPMCLMLIAEASEGPVGQVRFDVTGEVAMVSVGLAHAVRGKGYGPVTIRAAVERLMQSHTVRRVEALIRPTNIASLKAFEAAGFGPAGDTTVLGQPAHRYWFPQ